MSPCEFSVILFLVSLFSLKPFTSPVAYPILRVHRYAFPPLHFVVGVFRLLILSDVYSMHFVTFILCILLLLFFYVKRLQLNLICDINWAG